MDMCINLVVIITCYFSNTTLLLGTPHILVEMLIREHLHIFSVHYIIQQYTVYYIIKSLKS